MKKPTNKKAPAKKATTKTVVETLTKKESKTDTAKVSKSEIIEVVVKSEKFGNYKKGDTIKMHSSTAKGCIDSGFVSVK